VLMPQDSELMCEWLLLFYFLIVHWQTVSYTSDLATNGGWLFAVDAQLISILVVQFGPWHTVDY
jgi:hypothetical protein